LIEINLTPVPKPRMTQADRWKKRPATDRYWAYKDALKTLMDGIEFPEAYHVIFCLPMPKSWSKKKRAAHAHQRHLSKPDKDNLEKGWLDALFEDDSIVWDGRVSKVWAEEGAILLKPIEPFRWEDFG
jgi:Holliday junction resolvase RusA-like endonuclease